MDPNSAMCECKEEEVNSHGETSSEHWLVGGKPRGRWAYRGVVITKAKGKWGGYLVIVNQVNFGLQEAQHRVE